MAPNDSMQNHTHGVLFLPSEKVVLMNETDKKRSLLELGLKNKIPINSSCGGGGSCGTCRVIVRSRLDHVEPRNEIEQSMADARKFEPEERLSCQISPVDGLVVEVPQARTR